MHYLRLLYSEFLPSNVLSYPVLQIVTPTKSSKYILLSYSLIILAAIFFCFSEYNEPYYRYIERVRKITGSTYNYSIKLKGIMGSR